MRLKQAMDTAKPGQAVQICTTDPGFAADIKGWCQSTGSMLHSVTAAKGQYEAVVVKGQAAPAAAAETAVAAKSKTMVVFSGDFDKAMAAFIIANGAAAMGSKVTLFFTFWGLNLLRKAQAVAVKKTFIERMFGWMMPRGAEKTSLSKMNMAGMGTRMIKFIMKNKNVPALSELIETAKKIRRKACCVQHVNGPDGHQERGTHRWSRRGRCSGVP